MRRAAKTWGGDFCKNGGGGAVWDGFAYDPEANLVYVGTGNAEPWVQKFRGAQGLDNLYTCSILAVDLTTGQLKWHYQAVPNDNWDYDNVQQLMLLDLNINGRTRKVITQAAKNGFFYVLDRVTGEFISAEPFVKVSWALEHGQGWPAGGESRGVLRSGADLDLSDRRRRPQLVADVLQPEHRARLHSVVLSSFPYQAQAEFRPGSTGYVRPQGQTKIDRADLGPEPPTGARGGLQAWDPVKQKLKWNVEGGGGIGGGTDDDRGQPGVSGDQRRPLPRDQRRQGRDLCTKCGSLAPAWLRRSRTKWTASSMSRFGGGLGRAANVVGPNNAKVDNAPMMFVFALDGTAELPLRPAPPAAAPASGPAAVPAVPAPRTAELIHLLWPQSSHLKQVLQMAIEECPPRGAGQRETVTSEAEPTQ